VNVSIGRLVAQGIPEQELSLLREALQRGQLTGNQRFVVEVEQIIGCRIERRRPGRPPSRRP
jgi:putative transposase